MVGMRTAQAKTRGVALITALIFLLVLTILGVAGMSSAHLQEKMAGNLQDQTIAFQAAETGLKAGEEWIHQLINKPDFPNTDNGLYVPSTSATPAWEQVDWGGSEVVVYPNEPGTTVSADELQTSQQPRYIIEDLGEVPDQNGSLAMATNYKGKGTTVVRITARGTGRAAAAVAEVQSTYWKKF